LLDDRSAAELSYKVVGISLPDCLSLDPE